MRCPKSERHCGAKQSSKSKVLKTDGLRPLLEVEMLEKCTPLFREASEKMHFAWQAQYKRHVHHRLGGQGTDFLRVVAFWSISSSGLLR